jgi:SAM-dependent methyltransferase
MQYQNEEEFKELLELYNNLFIENVLEIGSLLGETLKYWIDYAPVGTNIYSIDKLVSTTDSRFKQQVYGHTKLWHDWSKEKGVHLTVFNAYSNDKEIIKYLKDKARTFDFIFIDGGHDYNTVKQDFETFYPMLNKGGMVAFHDIAKNHPASEVNKYWEEIKHDFTTYEFIFEPEQREYGIGVIYKI